MPNSYYNHTDPFTAGSTVRSDAANSKFDGIETGFDAVEVESDRSLKVPTGTGNEITADASTRANKLLAFDASGDLTIDVSVGEYKGAWATPVVYRVRDIIKDTAGALGLNNLYICNTEHTSANLSTDSAKWDLLVSVAEVEAAKVAAAASASAAASSASSASSSATNASASASAASTSESNSATSESNAAASAASAAADLASVQSLYDQFDDRYLGSKTGDPTLDNDGNALLTGALYWNSVAGNMQVYNGAAWELVSPDAATLLADIKTVDGTGSGLDADLLDGQEGSYYDQNLYGIGNYATFPDADLDTYVKNGIYRITSAITTNRPPGAVTGDSLIVSHYSSTAGIQLYFARSVSKIYYRQMTTGTWGGWSDLWISGVEGGGQLKFPATQNASADANTLDDYEEGTFTPVIYGTTTAGSPTYSVQSGFYTKIGDLVFASLNVQLSALGGMAGAVEFSGLPFPSHGSSPAAVDIGFAGGISLAAAGYSLLGAMMGSSDQLVIRVWDSTSGATNLLVTEITTSLSLTLTITYKAA